MARSWNRSSESIEDFFSNLITAWLLDCLICAPLKRPLPRIGPIVMFLRDLEVESWVARELWKTSGMLREDVRWPITDCELTIAGLKV